MKRSPTIVTTATASDRIVIKTRILGGAFLSVPRFAPQRLQNLRPSATSEPHAEQYIDALYQGSQHLSVAPESGRFGYLGQDRRGEGRVRSVDSAYWSVDGVSGTQYAPSLRSDPAIVTPNPVTRHGSRQSALGDQPSLAEGAAYFTSRKRESKSAKRVFKAENALLTTANGSLSAQKLSQNNPSGASWL